MSKLKPSKYIDLQPFQAWVQQSLPAIYDDSLSYTDLLAKMLAYLNKLVENNNTISTDVTNAINYINTFFESTDFQDKVDDKLNRMASDGSLSKLIQPLFDAYKKDIDKTVATQNTSISNIQSQQTVLKERMDTFTKLPSGSTSGDAELQDIRVGANGTTYPSAGEAVRGQYKQLNEALDDLNAYTENVISSKTFEIGHWYNGGFSTNKYFRTRKGTYFRGLYKIINGDSFDMIFIKKWTNDVITVKGNTSKYLNLDGDYAFYSGDGETDYSISDNLDNAVKNIKIIFIDKSESYLGNKILSDTIGFDLFEKRGQIVKIENNTTSYVNATGVSATYFVNIEKVDCIVFDNLYAGDYTESFKPIMLFDNKLNFIGVPSVDYIRFRPSKGIVYLSDYNSAKYAIFQCDSLIKPSVKFYVNSEKDKKFRNKVYVGAYYFAGWSELDFPNIHVTDSIMTTYSNRKPIWGWIEHGCFRGDGWLITPQIELTGNNSKAILTNSCIFYEDGQCRVFAREMNKKWVDVTPLLPNKNSSSMIDTEINLSSFDGKTIQLGFNLRNHASDISPIWTINKLKVISNDSIIYDKDYRNHDNFDCEINDDDIWKPATETLGYDGTNGYVGSCYNQKDYSIIDKQITLAKENGIDYFILDWYYHDNLGDFNQEATEKEDNHIALNAFMNSANKFQFNFIIMVSNHAGFEITSLDRWKDAFRYLNETYFKDSSYLIVDNKPVVNIFNRQGIASYIDDIETFFVNELGYDGVIWQFCGVNTAYNSIPSNNGNIERDFSELIHQNKGANEQMYNNVKPSMYYPFLTSGWDSRPWWVRPKGYSRVTDWYTRDADKWKEFFKWGYNFARYKTLGNFKSILICAFNEYGEGSYLVPTEGDKRASYLLAIKESLSELIN